ncbi:Periplasmic trehalase [Bienertia sinuspersici]
MQLSLNATPLRFLVSYNKYGTFYDEVVPTALELEGSKDGKQFLPPSCKYMFTTLQSITSTSGRSHVTFEEWCRFWFRAPKRYSATILPKTRLRRLFPLDKTSTGLGIACATLDIGYLLTSFSR